MLRVSTAAPAGIGRLPVLPAYQEEILIVYGLGSPIICRAAGAPGSPLVCGSHSSSSDPHEFRSFTFRLPVYRDQQRLPHNINNPPETPYETINCCSMLEIRSPRLLFRAMSSCSAKVKAKDRKQLQGSQSPPSGICGMVYHFYTFQLSAGRPAAQK